MSPVLAAIGMMAANGHWPSVLERRQQFDLARERIDLVHDEERALDLLAEHLDQGAVLTPKAARFDDEQRNVAVLERLVDLARHEPVQRAFRAARVAGRVDEHGLVRAAIQYTEHALARGVRFVGDDAELLADEGVQQGRLADVRPADDRDHAAAAGNGLRFAHLSAPRASRRPLLVRHGGDSDLDHW